ncbi:hypothetical protein V8G54_012029 [Vigna mungo]|uniref:Uncharacterized protein n=1 Tax=Vigna mungo TaxID=3915 RepID=A0AAQ3S2Z4_VIGMU
MNEQFEAANKIIVQELKKRLGEAKGGWVDEIDKVLWGYRCSPHSLTRESPFNLTYGTNAMLPVEIGEPTIRRQLSDMDLNAEQLQSNLDGEEGSKKIDFEESQDVRKLTPDRVEGTKSKN